MNASLITLDEAKYQLRVDFDDDDATIHMHSCISTDIVMRHIHKIDEDGNATHNWTSSNVPGSIKGSILMVLTCLYEDDMRADDSTKLLQSKQVRNVLFSNSVEAMLEPWRKPGLA